MANLVTKIIISAQDQASNIFDAIQRNAGKLATAVAGYFGFKLFSASVDSAREFETAMSRVQAAAGASADELATLKAAAEEAGATTQYTSVEAAAALENLAKAGLSASDAVATLPAVLDLATAGGVDLAAASDYISKAVAGMGLSFADAGRVADVLAMGANASLTSVEGLGNALSYAAPMAKTLGLSLEQTVAIIGKFADAGIDASRAGTALNSILAQFSNPASTFRRELAAAGITTGNFDQALRQLAAAGPAGQKAIIAVGQEAGPALRSLLNQGIGALDDLKGQLDNASGSARTFAAVMADNLDGASKGLGSAWESLKIKLGEPILGPLKDQINDLAARLREFVTNGTATKFGESIAAAFQSGAKWVKGFIAEVDFSAVYARLQAFAAETKAFFDDIGEKATNAGNVLKTAYGVMSAGVYSVITAWNSALRILYAMQEGVGRFASGVNSALASITFGEVSEGFKALAREMDAWADESAAAAQRYAEKSGESFAGIVRGAELASEGWDELTASTAAADTALAKVAESAKEASAELRQIVAQNDLASKSFAELGINSQQVAARLAEISAQTGVTVTSSRALRDAVREGAIAFDAATGEWSKGAGALGGVNEASAAVVASMAGFRQGLIDSATGAKALGDQSGDTAAKIRELTAQYKAFIAAGDVQAAAAIQEQIRALKALGNQAAATSEDVEAAFARLGVESTAALKRAADAARRDFELIRDSGQASAADIEASFTAYAEKAILANDGVADATLKAQAAAVGMKIEVDEAGKTVVRTMAESKKATEELTKATKDAAGGMGTIGEASAEAATGLAAAWDEAGNLIADAGEKIESGAQIIGRVSDGEIRRLARAWQEHGRYVSQMLEAHNARITAAEAEGRALERLARQQDRMNSSAGRGVDDLKMRLIELNGTEEEIAKARLERDKADVNRQIALLELDIKRANLRGESGEASRLRDEIKLLKEQLGLIDQVHKAEQRNSRSKGDSTSGSRSSSGGGMSSGSAAPPSAQGPDRSPVTRTVRLELSLGGRDAVPLTTTESEAARFISDLEAFQRVAQ